MNALSIFKIQGAVQTFPDTDRYKARFTVRSESSNNLYMISFDAAPNAGYWTCSCRGNISHGQCKHLTAIGQHGRKFRKDPVTLQILGLEK
jgi:hypothetical protein